jgi:hypothetical protein
MANTYPSPSKEFDDADEERNTPLESGNFKQALLAGGFEMLLFNTHLKGKLGTMVMFLGDPGGELVKDAQVITTIVGQSGIQQMCRARPRKGGYLIETEHLKFDKYRLEVEIVTDGWFLTAEFYFQKV